MATDTQVLVVGAGPVGLFMAAELNRHGVSCRIVDKNDGPTHASRAASPDFSKRVGASGSGI
jgi:2-polyprenyl-6-methoxyphenol hydroxylase-like FAD-dependent oxidoreductase